MNLQIVCAWCGSTSAKGGDAGIPENLPPITHSICPECRKRVFGKFDSGTI